MTGIGKRINRRRRPVDPTWLAHHAPRGILVIAPLLGALMTAEYFIGQDPSWLIAFSIVVATLLACSVVLFLRHARDWCILCEWVPVPLGKVGICTRRQLRVYHIGAEHPYSVWLAWGALIILPLFMPGVAAVILFNCWLAVTMTAAMISIHHRRYQARCGLCLHDWESAA